MLRQQDSTPPSRLTPSCSARPTSAPSSSSSDVSLGDIMAQLQVNVRVGRIARR